MKSKGRKRLLKVFSLLFSSFLWFYVIGKTDAQLEKVVHVKYILPKNKAIADEDIKDVTYYLNGPRAFIRTLEDREDVIIIDLTNNKRKSGGRVEVVFRPHDLALPFGVNVTKIEPKRLTLTLEKAITKEVLIRPQYIGSLSPDQKLIRESLSPGRIKIRGPVTLLRNFDSIATQPIELSGITGEGIQIVELQLPDERIQFIDETKIEFRYLVKPMRANMVIENIKIKFLTSRYVRKASRRSVSLVVLSDKGSEVDIPKSEIEVLAEIPENQRGKVEVELKAKLPAGIHLLEIKPKKIFVYVN